MPNLPLIGVCHSPRFYRSQGQVFRDQDPDLLTPFDFITPRCYLCAPALLDCGDLISDELATHSLPPIHGHSLVPFRSEHTPKQWGGSAYGYGQYRTVGVGDQRRLKIDHAQATLQRFPSINHWVVGLEVYLGSGRPAALFLDDYIGAVRSVYPDKHYTISEICGRSTKRWDVILDTLRYMENPPDSIGLQIHHIYGTDFSEYRRTLEYVAEKSHLPLHLSEVCLWYAADVDTPTDDAIALFEELRDIYPWQSICWWHWSHRPVWNLRGRPFGVAVVSREYDTFVYTEFGRYLLLNQLCRNR